MVKFGEAAAIQASMGPDAFAQAIKDWAHQALVASLHGADQRPTRVPSLFDFFPRDRWSVKGLATFASVARALPVPPAKKQKETEKKTTRILKAMGPGWDESTAKSIEDFCFKITSKALDRFKEHHPDEATKFPLWKCSVNPSACLERSVAEGGAYEHVRLQTMAQFKGQPTPSLEDQATAMRNVVVGEYFELRRMNPQPMCRMTVVGTGGWKNRAVSVSNAADTLIMSPYNTLLLRLLKRMRPAADALYGRDFTSMFNKSLKKKGMDHAHYHFYSSDLSQATDRIAHWAAFAAWEGVGKVLGLPPQVIAIGKRTLGEHLIFLSDGTAFKNKQGILMGLPLVWPILNLLNMWCAEHNQDGRPIYVVHGDDLAGLWTDEQARRYELNLAKIGLKLNRQKTIRSEDGGVFCEQLVKLVWSTGEQPTQKLSWGDRMTRRLLKVIPIRRVQMSEVSLGKRLTETGRPIDVSVPISLTMPDALTNAWKKASHDQRRHLIPVAQELHPHAFFQLQTTRLPFFWPKELGGCGLPSTCPGAPPKFRKAAAVLFSLEQELRDERIALNLAQWRTHAAPDYARGLVKEAFERLSLIPRSHGGIKRDQVEPEVMARVLARGALNFENDKRPAKVPYHSLHYLGTFIRGVTEEVALVRPKIQPMGPRNAIKALKNKWHGLGYNQIPLEKYLADLEPIKIPLIGPPSRTTGGTRT
jgi:hypothetical protein